MQSTFYHRTAYHFHIFHCVDILLENCQILLPFVSLPRCVFVIHSFDSASGSFTQSRSKLHQPAWAALQPPGFPAYSDLHVSFRSHDSQWGARIHSQALPCWQVFKPVLVPHLTCRLDELLRSLLFGIFNKTYRCDIKGTLHRLYAWRSVYSSWGVLLSLRQQQFYNIFSGSRGNFKITMM